MSKIGLCKKYLRDLPRTGIDSLKKSWWFLEKEFRFPGSQLIPVSSVRSLVGDERSFVEAVGGGLHEAN